MINEIVEEISKRTTDSEGKLPVFGDKRYVPIEFSETNYHEIGKGSSRTIAFIDGGNAEIVKVPGLSLQLMRNACVVVMNNRVVSNERREFYVLVTATEKGVKAKIYGDGEVQEIEEKTDELAKFCDSIRRSSEIKLAIEMLNEADMIVLDGTLEAKSELEKKHLNELRYETITRGKITAALAKTTTITTEKGTSFAGMLGRKKRGSWLYNPVVDIKSDYHKAEMFFVKLNEKSSYVFRVEVFKESKVEMDLVAAELKENARDLSFPGYPYGLVMADKLARVSNREVDILKTKMFAAAGSKWAGLDSEMAALNAHDMLDRM